MTGRIFTLIAICSISSGSPLSYWEQKLVGSWQVELKPGERLVTTYEPDRSYWTLLLVGHQISPGVTARWSVDDKAEELILSDVHYASPADGRPSKQAITLNGIGEETFNLAGLIFTRCQRPTKPSKAATSSPSPGGSPKAVGSR